MLERCTSTIVFSASRGAPITTASASSVFGAGNLPYCTFPVTEALPVMVNVQVAVLLPPLEHAPDQMASRPLLTLKVIELLVAKPDDCVLPTATLMPTGLDTTRSPLRPLAVTVKLTPAAAGFTVSAATDQDCGDGCRGRSRERGGRDRKVGATDASQHGDTGW